MCVKNKTWLWWSSGKDSAWSLHLLRQNRDICVDALITSVNITANRVAMHAVRRALLDAQAQALGLPVYVIEIPYPCPDGAYEQAAQALIAQAEDAGVTHMAFGDLYLQPIRHYRLKLLQKSPIQCLFPVWLKDTRVLAQEMVDSGLQAYITCVDPQYLSSEFVGRRFDAQLLGDLPAHIDPCGENGEFHTFVYALPDFNKPIKVCLGERIVRDGIYFIDIMPA